MLEKAVNSPQGCGYGIRISLEKNLEPSEVSWIHNRWPRYRYQVGSLDIRLQYYVDCQSLVQQYQIRNNSHEAAYLPYTISSEICIREHKVGQATSHPISARKSFERLLLFGNSEVVVRNARAKVQVKTAVFLNAQRTSARAEQSLGAETSDANDPTSLNKESNRVEDELRQTILAKRFPSRGKDVEWISWYSRHYDRKPGRERSRLYERDNFAEHRNRLLVPGKSTQELCAIIQILELPQPEPELNDAPSSDSHAQTHSIWERQSALRGESKDFSPDTSDPVHMSRVSRYLDEHVSLGEEFAKDEWTGEARYHFYTAYLIGESFFSQDPIRFGKTRFRYARFLDNNGWCSDAFTMVNDLFHDLSTKDTEDGDVFSLWMEVLSQLASMCLDKNEFGKAEALYEQALSRFLQGGIKHNPSSAGFLERVAWTQVYQEKYEEADRNYTHLLDRTSFKRRTLLSNRCFIKRRLGQYQEAQKLYEIALQGLPSGSQEHGTMSTESSDGYQGHECGVSSTMDILYSLSGLFSCLVELHINCEYNQEISGVFVEYIDVSAALAISSYVPFPFSENPLHFAIVRQLESLLSVCSIPVKRKNGETGISFVDGDLLNCVLEGRFA